MMVTRMQLHFVVGLLLCFIISNVSSQDCHYSQNLKDGVTYYVYNSGYPGYTNGQENCTWDAKSDKNYRIKLACNITIRENNDDCYYNRLTVYVNNITSYYYCGNKTFSVVSTGNSMTIKSTITQPGSRFLCTLQTILLDCTCGRKKPTKIVGGKETGVNEYPMMAGLVDITMKEVYCGATIISSTYVLSAAHCVINKIETNIKVLVGDHDLNTGKDTSATKLYNVSNFNIHPDFNTSKENDIAVVKVESEIVFNAGVGPVCLPFQHFCDSFAGDYVTLLGWGTTSFGGRKSNTLQETTVSVLTNKQCSQSYPNISDDQLCTYARGKDACQFDSGGPVLWQNPTTEREVLVGIIKSGIGCATDEPGINTRVNKNMDWILKMTADTTYCEEE